jgi:hypothetical protein
MDDTELIEEEYADDFAVVAALEKNGPNTGCGGCFLMIFAAVFIALLLVLFY